MTYDENYVPSGDECWDTALNRMVEHDDINPEFKSKSTMKHQLVACVELENSRVIEVDFHVLCESNIK